MPSVHQSGDHARYGGITKAGSKALRSALVQSGHVLLFRCRNEDSLPLRQIVDRIQVRRGRRKIAVVAAARHLLRIAFYILRDESVYRPELLGAAKEVTAA